MNLQLRRKQIFVLAFAGVLAVTSYWIPAPHDAAPTPVTQNSSQQTNA